MRDVNGCDLHDGDYCQLLVRIEEIGSEHIRIRVANSKEQLGVGFHFDEALGGDDGLVADSELLFLAHAEKAPDKSTP